MDVSEKICRKTRLLKIFLTEGEV